MAKVIAIQVYYNHRRFVDKVFPAVLNQSHKDLEFVVVIAGNDDGGKEYIQEKYPQVKIIDPGYNIGFARGHNEFFAQADAEFFQLVNPDLILEPNYIEEMLKAFGDSHVAAATGKLLQYDFENDRKKNVFDTTGVVYAKSGRARDRGQHEEDHGQYDQARNVIAVSGAGPMYRKSALETVKYQREDGRVEYFDEDFHTYFEDVDLGLRFISAGFKNVFVPSAVGYHGRGVGSTKGGYKNTGTFIKHHQKIAPWIRQLNYKNHIFLAIKNFPRFYLQFFVREFFYNCYVLVFETGTFKVWPEFFRQLPMIWRKRKYIAAHRKISIAEFEKYLV